MNLFMFENLAEKLNLPEGDLRFGEIKTQVSFLPALKAVSEFKSEIENLKDENAQSSGEILVITTDSGYFAAGKELRDGLKSGGERVSVFCADDGEIAPENLKNFIFSVERAKLAAVIGGADLYNLSAPFLREKNIKSVFVPSGCEIGSVFCSYKNAFGTENREFLPQLIVFDAEFIEKSANKYKNYSACCYVESVRLLLFEAEVFAGVRADKQENLSGINEKFKTSLGFLNDYYLKSDLKSLFFACVSAGILKKYAERIDVGDAASAFAFIAGGYARGENVFGGEAEFYAAQILLLIYENFFKSDYFGWSLQGKNGSFFLSLPCALEKTLKLEKDFGFKLSDLPKLPDYFYNDEKLAALVGSILKNAELKQKIEKLKGEFVKSGEKLKSVYGGKWRAVKSLGEKVKIDALKLTPFLTRGDCLIKVFCACGAFENLNDSAKNA